MLRENIKNELLTVQEVDGMHVVRVYATIEDFTNFLRSKMSDEQLKEFDEYHWFPTRIAVENDMTVDFTLMAVK